MKYKLNDYIRYIEQDNFIIIMSGLNILNIQKDIWSIIQNNDEISVLENLLDAEIFNEIIDKLVIVQDNYYSEEDRYVRTKAYNDLYSIMDKNDYNKKILILGAGGTGTWILYLLKNSGFKNITVLDYDLVELTNLNRQICYTKEDIGKPKVNVLKEYYNNEISIINKKIIKKDDLIILKQFDFVFKCIDSPIQIHQWVNQVCTKNNVKYYSWMMLQNKIQNTKYMNYPQEINEIKGKSASHPIAIMEAARNMYWEFMCEFTDSEKFAENQINIWNFKNHRYVNKYISYFTMLLSIVNPFIAILLNALIKTKNNKWDIFIRSLIITVINIIFQMFQNTLNINSLLLAVSVPFSISLILNSYIYK